MSAEVEIKLSGAHYRELVKTIEGVAAQRQPRSEYVENRIAEIRALSIEEGMIATKRPTEEELAEYEGLRLERGRLAAFFDAKRAFFS